MNWGMLGLVTALLGTGAGLMAAWLVTVRLMDLNFVATPLPALAAACAAVAVTILLGLLGTLRALGQKPAEILRNL